MPDVRSPSPPVEPELDDPLPASPPTSPLAAWVALGLLVLVGTFALIVSSATRSARAEERGDRIAAALLREARLIAPIDFSASWLHEHLYARLLHAAAADDLFVSDLVLREPRETPGFAFLNKHYCIEVRPSPRADSEAGTDEGEVAFEVLAWPRSRTGPARSVFFHPADAEAAYSRNLQEGYVDEDSAALPAPGRAHRRNDGRGGIWDYRGFDDERWLLEQRPAQ